MPRYIDADRFNSFGYDTKGYDFKSFDAGVECILKMIDDAPTVEPADIIQAQWISVKKQLPPNGLDVLIRFESNCAVGYYISAVDVWCIYTDNEGHADMVTGARPLFWMSLPEIPETQEDD
jgi:hypothetical protein